jgi:hypothetical protein
MKVPVTLETKLDHGALRHPRGTEGSSVPTTADAVTIAAADAERHREARRQRLATSAEANRAAATRRRAARQRGVRLKPEDGPW